MMKKLLSLIVLVGFAYAASAQCTPPDPNTTPTGFHPDPNQGENIAPGDPGVSYSQTLEFKVPSDTTVTIQGFSVQADIDSVSFDTIMGLPNGLSYQCNDPDCTYDSLETGCIQISGTINDTAGTYEVSVMVTFYGMANLGGNQIPAETAGSLPFAVYQMEVGDVSVQTLNPTKFDVVQNIPNPFSGETTIKFNNPVNTEIEFAVYDMLGKQVDYKKFEAEAGENSIKYRADKLNAGAYFYTLSNGSERLTKRMIVK
jgi:hypothetical protein